MGVGWWGWGWDVLGGKGLGIGGSVTRMGWAGKGRVWCRKVRVDVWGGEVSVGLGG